MREVLLSELELVWGFATRFVVRDLDPDLVAWEPSTNVVAVRSGPDGWVADWPDEEHPPIPEATVAWLLWHIEFWWGNAIRASRGEMVRAPDQVRWSGSTEGLQALHDEWAQTLKVADLDRAVVGLMPEPRPFWFVAAWVTFELTKNLAEINQLVIRWNNR